MPDTLRWWRRPKQVSSGLDDFNCSCMPPQLLHGNGGSFEKPRGGHALGAFYRQWRDSPPDLAAHGAEFVAQRLEGLTLPRMEEGSARPG